MSISSIKVLFLLALLAMSVLPQSVEAGFRGGRSFGGFRSVSRPFGGRMSRPRVIYRQAPSPRRGFANDFARGAAMGVGAGVAGVVTDRLINGHRPERGYETPYYAPRPQAIVNEPIQDYDQSADYSYQQSQQGHGQQSCNPFKPLFDFIGWVFGLLWSALVFTATIAGCFWAWKAWVNYQKNRTKRR